MYQTSKLDGVIPEAGEKESELKVFETNRPKVLRKILLI